MTLISILIPTRNRPELARLAVRAALAAADEHCEILVADNGDTPLDLTGGDPRLRHLRPGRVLSMPDNWERAVQEARGDWVMLLADKYMLVPGAVGALRAYADRGHPVVTYAYGVLRQYLELAEESDPGVLASRGGELQWPATPGATEVRASREALKNMLAHPHYPRQCPMLYTALVHRRVLDGARRRTGRVFVGPCPDVASAAQVLSESDRWLATLLPAVMVQYPSTSALWSTGAAAMAGGERAREYFEHLAASGWKSGEIGQLVAGAVFETYRSFLERRPDLAQALPLSWEAFARYVSWEVQPAPLGRWARVQWKLLRYTQYGGARPQAALAQLKAALARFAPERLRRAVRRDQEGSPSPPVLSSRFETRDAALGFLSRLVREGTETR